jgi:hypothetical protein
VGGFALGADTGYCKMPQECGPDDPVRSVDTDAADCIPGV